MGSQHRRLPEPRATPSTGAKRYPSSDLVYATSSLTTTVAAPSCALPVDLWTRPADRPEPCGTCGQPMDRAARRRALGKIRAGAAHRLPTLSGLAPTTPQAQQQVCSMVLEIGAGGTGEKPATHRKRNRGTKYRRNIRSKPIGRPARSLARQLGIVMGTQHRPAAAPRAPRSSISARKRSRRVVLRLASYSAWAKEICLGMALLRGRREDGNDYITCN